MMRAARTDITTSVLQQKSRPTEHPARRRRVSSLYNRLKRVSKRESEIILTCMFSLDGKRDDIGPGPIRALTSPTPQDGRN